MPAAVQVATVPAAAEVDVVGVGEDAQHALDVLGGLRRRGRGHRRSLGASGPAPMPASFSGLPT